MVSAWRCGCASSTGRQLAMEEQQRNMAVALLCIVEVVCLLPALTPHHPFWRQLQCGPCFPRQTPPLSAASALVSLQPWDNCCKVQDACAKGDFAGYCPYQVNPVRNILYISVVSDQ